MVVINHPKRNDSLVRNRILHERQRTEPGIDGLARTNLRFSSQGGPQTRPVPRWHPQLP
jgi:hypothetical protein